MKKILNFFNFKILWHVTIIWSRWTLKLVKIYETNLELNDISPRAHVVDDETNDEDYYDYERQSC